ncbi:ribonucleotide reductase [Alteromonas phage vB_AmeM_PT11-V22]|uniref:Ribonucleotide reductase large subunit C-terminal domain-containing protein n=1 Tax=Alteromonas phage vB_AmeM_PT11-V22 TaxID=2704031 RepID=A0A6C0R1D8_9CAUD|nr:ribonucleotide reductase [Alteromonas phage vB_AmeM_PT11-V22]QHZ59803.1 hypothetical protein [Alteromonas phage vB_AmeM_PT11-V22]
MSDSIFEEFSKERKKLQKEGKLPDWFTTLSWQAFTKYMKGVDTFEEQIDRIVNAVGNHCPSNTDYFKRRWKECIMDNHAYLATPVLGNAGTDYGMPVSCSGNYVGDSIYDFYDSLKECAVLSQEGFGTSSYLGGIRERGASISRGGKANGVQPVAEDFVTMSQKVSQGGARRGAWAGYIDLQHNDFWEIANYVKNEPEGTNVGYNLYDEDVKGLNEEDEDLVARMQRVLSTKMITGRGYLYFPDKVKRAQPPMYEALGLSSKASNLCTEITLHSDEEHTYTCVLSGMVCSTYDEWKDTDAVYVMTVFLDCLVSYFLEKARGVKGLEKAVRGTEKSRALGLGVSGFHSYLQKNMIAFESFEAHMKNNEIFDHLAKNARKASEWMAKEWGEPEWCKGYGVRNTHTVALAPNVTSALIFGSESQGITPWYGNAYTEGSASGGLFRINPLFAELLKKHGQYTEEVIDSVQANKGSCQHLDFLSDEEKEVFKTFFEIDQTSVIRLASSRQKAMDKYKQAQAQSLNLAFDAEEDPAYIMYVHAVAANDENIKSLYYIRSQAGVNASKGVCVACES